MRFAIISSFHHYVFRNLIRRLTLLCVSFNIGSTKGRGVARGGGGSWGARDPLLVGPLLSKQPTIFRWRKRHDNILAVKAIVEKPSFFKFVFL